HQLNEHGHLDLTQLTSSVIVEYLSSQRRVPDRQVRRAAARLREQTGGNPFFLRELWRDLAGHGVLGSIHPAALAAPESVKDALERRLDPPTAEHQEVIELGAVAGEK